MKKTEPEDDDFDIPFDPKKDRVDPSHFLPKTRELSVEQQRAVDLCCDQDLPIVGITGGAGTGKTTVLGTVFSELKANKVSAVLCAPTGRAAKRVQELTKIPARTVHRVLGYPMPDEDADGNQIPGEPKHNRRNPIPFKCIAVDESSMLSPTLYDQLIDAMPKGGMIRFFGDNNQLPPVESGKPPFIDVLERFPQVTLSFNYRSDDAIVSNAGRILRGLFPVKNDRFSIIYTTSPIDFLLDFVKGHKEFARDDHQIIVPTRRGKHGTDRINPSLQLKFNPRGPLLKLDRYDEKGKEQPQLGVRKGDKYLWIKNDYKLDMFNGEIGRIESVDTEQGCLTLSAGDRSVLVEPRIKMFSPYHGTVIDYDPRKQIELGYAITTHKSQGSEFDTVVYVITRGHYYLLNRRNFYTAITRAKRHVVLITDRSAIGMSMRKHQV